MVCKKCNTQIFSSEKFCSKCGNLIVKNDNDSLEQARKGLLIIGTIIFVFTSIFIYYIIFLIIYTRWIIRLLPNESKEFMILVIFTISIVASISTVIPTYQLFKRKILKIDSKK